MLDTFLEYFKKIVNSRILPIAIIYVILFSILVSRIFTLQIIGGQKFQDKSISKDERNRVLKSMRGRIYDCNNNLLAYNVLSYSITLEDTGELTTNKEKNGMIYKMIHTIEKNGDQLDTEFFISLNKYGEFVFNVKDKAELSFKRDAFFVKYVEDLTEIQKKYTAEQMFEYLRTDVSSNGPKFNISAEYSKADALKIMAVRYAMLINPFEKYIPISISTNVSEETISAIKENSYDLPGVEVTQEAHRVYNDSLYFSHILGYTGLISSESLAESEGKDKNENIPTYISSDQVGKTGIEKQFENDLKGKKGNETLTIDANYRVIEVKDRIEPATGNDIYLTIDSNLQKACYTILEKKIAGILLSKLTNSMDVGSKGTSSADIKIPIYDAYFSLIENKVIDVSTFDNDDATSLEKSVHKTFKNSQKSVLSSLKGILSVDSTQFGSDLSEDSQSYLDFIYSNLVSKKVILTDSIDKTDKKYLDYVDHKLSLSSFLQYAIAKKWIDLSVLSLKDNYFSTEEIYNKLMDYVFKGLKNDSSFNKLIYNSLVYTYKLSGTEICLLLFDQGVLKYDEEAISSLRSGGISPYNFLCQKIENLEITPAQLALEPCSGSVIITDVNNGKVKAMVSYPSYDNNLFANRIDADYYSYIINNTASPLLNRTTSQMTAPGSTFKMVTSVAALEEGVISPSGTVKDLIEFKKIDPAPSCWSKSSHGAENISNALRDSCNYFFYEMGYRLSSTSGGIFNNTNGLNKLKKYAEIFGLSNLSGVELAEAKPSISNSDAVRSSIGQGTNSFAPIQLSRYVTTIANKGTSFNLTIIDSIKDTNNNVLLQNKASVLNKVKVQSSTWASVQAGMYKVVDESSISPLFKDSTVKVAGKTGTAQESKSKPNHALFVSYAPYDNPEISVTTVIPNGFTSSNAAELARDVYRYYYDESAREEILNSKVEYPELDGRSFSD